MLPYQQFMYAQLCSSQFLNIYQFVDDMVAAFFNKGQILHTNISLDCVCVCV